MFAHFGCKLRQRDKCARHRMPVHRPEAENSLSALKNRGFDRETGVRLRQARGPLKTEHRRNGRVEANSSRFCFSVVNHLANVLFQERFARLRRVEHSRNREETEKTPPIFCWSFTEFCCLTMNIGIMGILPVETMCIAQGKQRPLPRERCCLLP